MMRGWKVQLRVFGKADPPKQCGLTLHCFYQCPNMTLHTLSQNKSHKNLILQPTNISFQSSNLIERQTSNPKNTKQTVNPAFKIHTQWVSISISKVVRYVITQIQLIETQMGCADSKQPPPTKSGTIQKVGSNIKPVSNVQDSSISKSNIKILSPAEVEEKRRDMHKNMTEGNSRPPISQLPKLPLLEFGVSDEETIYNEILPGTEEPGFTPIYRQKGVKKLIQTPDPNLRSVRDILRQCKTKYGNKCGIGEIIVKVEKGPNGEPIEKRSVKQHTYNQIYETSYNLGKALAHRGLAFKENTQGLNILGIYSKNRLQWFITDWACALFGYVLAPLYDTLGKESLAHCISLTGITTLFVSAKTAEELLKFHQKGTLKTLVLFDELPNELSEKLKAEGLQLLHYSELVDQGSQLSTSNEGIAINPQDVYSFCFTSGTTGPPKAAMVMQRNMLTALVAFAFHKDLAFKTEDVHLSYLPLPHLMERTIANAIFLSGALLVISSGNVLKIREDAAAAQITLFVSVPRIFNRTVEGVKAMLAQMVTDEAKRPAITKAVYEKVRLSFGGKVRIVATGSAPINAEVQQAMQKIMGCPMIEGYGQTESPCGILFSRKTSTQFAVLHQLSSGAEVRLADIPQMKYTSKDTDSQGRPTPRGEICVRGPHVFGGYYKMEALSKETVDGDGWLRTGDVGEITPQLGFKIIDRKKNIFKLQQGEYIAPDRVEACYLQSGYIEEIFLHGSSNQNYAVAIVVPKKDHINKIAAQLGIEGTVDDLCQNTAVKALLLGELNSHARLQGLFGYQTAKNVYLDANGFASRNILTNTQKIIRFEARNSYKDQIDALYAQGELKL